jgi:hypothetical protein
VQRGLTYNAANNQLYLTDRSTGNNVRVLNGDNGALISSLNMTGVNGGTFPINMVDVAEDGAIYVGNLAIGANFKIYRWANDAAVPTVAFDAATGLSRVGDTFAVIGSGADTRIIASGSGHAGIAVFDTADGVNFSLTSANAIGGVAAGGFRLGMDFINANTAIGEQTGSTNIYTADLNTSTGQTFSVQMTGEAPLDYYASGPLLATVDISNSDVRLYDASDLSVLATTGFQDLANNLTAPHVVNTNGTGDLAFGIGPDGRLRLYALNTNNGIQAFVIVPEPATWLLGGLAVILIGYLRGRWR